MTPVQQTIFAQGPDKMPGNCLQAALASLLDLPLETVPHFVGDDWVTEGEKHWWTQWRRWCRERGLCVTANKPEPEAGEYYLGGGPSPRNPEKGFHVAIYRDGKLVHDPHPDGTGVTEVRTRWVIRPEGQTA